MKGGSLKVKELKAFLDASYQEDSPKEIMGYTLDEQLSGLYGKVYVNQGIKKVVLVHRGTVENIDWANNATYAINSAAYKLTPRYKQAKKMVDAALKKYKGYTFESAGHSQGGLLTHLLGSKSKNSIGLNPAYKNESLANNETIIRSSGDVVSALSVPKKFANSLLYPGWTKKHMITIPAKTSNPIEEHKIDILNRLDPEMKIGKGKKIMGGCACKLNDPSKIDLLLGKGKNKNDKVLWNSIQIQVPDQMFNITKTGKLSIRNTLTSTKNPSKSEKFSSVQLIPANIDEPKIINKGKKYNYEELQERLIKAKQLSLKYKNSDIFKKSANKEETAQKLKGYVIHLQKNISNKKQKAIQNEFKKLVNDIDKKINEIETKKLSGKEVAKKLDIIEKWGEKTNEYDYLFW